jgi:putative endonuclease
VSGSARAAIDRRQSGADPLYRVSVRQYFVYILANRSGRIYVGVTSDLRRRVWQNKNGVLAGYTRDYGLRRLVYFEQTADVHSALRREKQLKRWPRLRKDRLIEDGSPTWADLSAQW